MEVKIECPQCQTRLRLPVNACGELARCPRCHTKFRVPDSASLMEDTVAGWLFEVGEATATTDGADRTGESPSAQESTGTPSADQPHGGPWHDLPAQVRHRLAKWVDFTDGERFLAYLPDRDLPKFEMGLHGVVVTDQRVIFCNDQQTGGIHLDAYGELMLVKNGAYYDLLYHHDNVERALGQLRREAAQELAHMLDEQKNRLRVVRAKP